MVEQLGYSCPCFVTGLLGGAVYVGAFSLIADDILKGSHRDFSLQQHPYSHGIVCADVIGIFIQQQLYAVHGISSNCLP